MWTWVNSVYTIERDSMVTLLIFAVVGASITLVRKRHAGIGFTSGARIGWRNLAGVALLLAMAGSALTPFAWPLVGR